MTFSTVLIDVDDHITTDRSDAYSQVGSLTSEFLSTSVLSGCFTALTAFSSWLALPLRTILLPVDDAFKGHFSNFLILLFCFSNNPIPEFFMFEHPISSEAPLSDLFVSETIDITCEEI